MDVTYHVKDLADVAAHFEEKAKALRAETPKRTAERHRNEGTAFAYEQVADMLRRTKLETS